MFRIMKQFTRPLFFSAVIGTMLAIAMFFGVAFTPVVQAQPLVGNSIDYVAQLDSPAVVRIISAVSAQLVCHSCARNGSDIVSPQSGSLQYDWSGSGAFISPDGYILTADHVVDHTINNPDDVAFIMKAAATDIAQRYGLAPSDVLQFLQNHPGQVTINMSVTSQQAFLSTAYTGQLQSMAQMISYPVLRIATNSPVAKQDIAIIQVQLHDAPYLKLASASTLNAGDTITVIAYPADADLSSSAALLTPTQSNVNTLNSLLDVSVNTGQITGQKTLQDGTPIYEAGGGIASPGSSGGPVISQQGQIIGFVDAGPSTGTDRLAFLIPSSVVVSYAQQSGIANPSDGSFMSLWTQAITAYDATTPCHWTQAYQALKELHANYPRFGAVVPLLQQAQVQATPAECPAPTNSGVIISSVGAGAAILAGAALLVFFILRRRKQTAPVSVSTSNAKAAGQMQPVMHAPAGGGHFTPPPFYPSPYGTTSDDTTVLSRAHPGMNGNNVAASPVLPSALPRPAWTGPQPGTAVRRCPRGHVVSDRTASFCPECGALIQEVHV